MNQYETLHIEDRGNGVATCLLNRPDKKNALNPQMIQELTHFFDDEGGPAKEFRIVVLRGSGGFFCAGADLNWMKESAGFSAEQNKDDAQRLFDVFATLNRTPCLTVACVEGGAFGGGIGLISCCDVVLAAEDCRFSLSEVRLGLSPATISPFVTEKIGHSNARRLMLTAVLFNAQHGREIGLLHEICPPPELQAKLDETVEAALQCGPVAVAQTKDLLRRMLSLSLPDARLQSSDLIAGLRTGSEGQEGLTAFMEKRKPNWVPKD